MKGNKNENVDKVVEIKELYLSSLYLILFILFTRRQSCKVYYNCISCFMDSLICCISTVLETALREKSSFSPAEQKAILLVQKPYHLAHFFLSHFIWGVLWGYLTPRLFASQKGVKKITEQVGRIWCFSFYFSGPIPTVR